MLATFHSPFRPFLEAKFELFDVGNLELEGSKWAARHAWPDKLNRPSTQVWHAELTGRVVPAWARLVRRSRVGPFSPSRLVIPLTPPRAARGRLRRRGEPRAAPGGPLQPAPPRAAPPHRRRRLPRRVRRRLAHRLRRRAGAALLADLVCIMPCCKQWCMVGDCRFGNQHEELPTQQRCCCWHS